MTSNAKQLYERIKSDPEQTQLLFRQALQNPQGALDAICELGSRIGLPVSPEEVKEYLSGLDDQNTKQWVIKARGGL